MRSHPIVMELHCPHCRRRVEVHGPGPAQVICPGCGSSLGPAPDETVAQPWTGLPRRLGKFELLQQLGVGAFGTVYKARDTELGRMVALKVPRADDASGTADAATFLREARSAAQLCHPSIVSVFDAGHADGTCFIVSELVEGVTLADRLTAGRPAFAQAAELVAHAADALQHAHEHGLIHRDVKPSNIIVDPQGRPHLTDFGLAKRDPASAEMTLATDGRLLGTPAYMSPEQARGEAHRVDGRSDIYSLGVILYQLLTGELPFRGSGRMVIHQVINEEPRPPRRLNEHLPRDLETICLKAMAKEPTRRYPTARDMAGDLRHWLAGEPILARPAGRVEKTWRWCRRNPALAATGAMTVAALVATAAISVSFAVYHSFTADRLREEKKQTTLALDEASRRRAESDEHRARADERERRAVRLATEMSLDQALSRFEQFESDAGMLGLARSLTLAPPDAPDLQRAIRANLSAWLPAVSKLRACFEQETAVYALTFDPQGKRLASGAVGGRVTLWDVAGGQRIGQPWRHDGPSTLFVRAVAFTPEGTLLASGDSAGVVRLWDTAAQRSVGQPLHHDFAIESLAFNDDGTKLATGDRGGIARVWDVKSLAPIRQPLGHPGPVYAVKFSSDGASLLTCSGKHGLMEAPVGGQARVWAIATGTMTSSQPLRHPGTIQSAAFSRDGSRVVTGGLDRTAMIWDARTGNAVGRAMEHPGTVVAAAFSPDGRRLLTGDVEGIAWFWDAATGKALGGPLRHRDQVLAVAFSPDGNSVASGSRDRTLRLWDAGPLRPAAEPMRHRPHVHAIAFRRDSARVVTASCNGMVRHWNLAGGPLVHESVLYSMGKIAAPVALGADASQLVTLSGPRVVQMWDTSSGREALPPWRHDADVEAIALGAGDTRVLTGCRDGAAMVWDARTGAPIGPALRHDGKVTAVAVSPDGLRVATGSDLSVRMWDAATAQPIGAPLPHPGFIKAIAFSPDGSRMIVGTDHDTAHLWDASRLGSVGPALQHKAWVVGVTFSPDGSWVATASHDQTARVWEAQSGTPIGPALRHDGPVTVVAFSPDGTHIVTGGLDEAARVWDVPPPLQGEPQHILLWAQVLTGVEIDAGGTLAVLTAPDWQDRRRRLEGNPDGAPVAARQLDRLVTATTRSSK